ncbi:MAG: TetR/AcrR family transcriptional regulator [Bacteroidota bacterium]
MGKIVTNKNLTRKEVIIEKAAELFKEKGYKASGMRELAEVLGVEAASLYNHIKSKSELLHLICFEVANRYNLVLDEIEHKKINSLAKIEEILRFHIHGMINHYQEVYVCDREWKYLEEPYLSNFQTQRRSYRKKIAAIIEQGIQKKEIKAIDAPTAVLIMLHAISGIESWHRSKQKIGAKELEENMIAILISGLKK